MTTLQQLYSEQLVAQLKKELGITNDLAVPRITKAVINVGVTQPVDPRARRQVIDNVVAQIKVISGQQPVVTVAKKSISTFKLRAGDPLGVRVTLRSAYMWEFLTKLIAIALPRVKDFRGVPRTAFDGHGNYSLGIDEQIIFPEINYDSIDSIRSLQVVISTTAKNDQQAYRLLELLGMPFAKETQKQQ